jgi:hypothetical protein
MMAVKQIDVGSRIGIFCENKCSHIMAIYVFPVFLASFTNDSSSDI